MARKGKNDNLKDSAQDYEKKGPPSKKEPKQAKIDCGHSIGVLPYLLQAPARVQVEMAVDRMSKLRRLYKQKFGFKPVGMSEAELDAVLTAKGVDTFDTQE